MLDTVLQNDFFAVTFDAGHQRARTWDKLALAGTTLLTSMLGQ